MAAVVVTRTWLVSLGNTTKKVANALIAQGLVLSDLHDLEPSDIKTLCNSARRPGGLLMNGHPNPGMNVPTLLQLKLMVAVRDAQFYDVV